MTARILLLCLLTAAPTMFTPPAKACPARLGVAFGDSLAQIARRCGTSVEALRSANPGLTAENLRAGTFLAVPRSPLPKPQLSIGRGLVPAAPPGPRLSGTISIESPRNYHQPPVAGPIIALPPSGVLPPGQIPDPFGR